MDHRLLKFLAIVEHKSFTSASHSLHVSQPALTSAIQQLERELRTPLLIRHKRQFSLTPAGQAVYAGAVRLRIEYNAMLQQVRDHGQSRPSVRIGMLDTVAGLMIPPLRARLAGQQVEVTVDNSARLINDVRVGRLELAIIVQQDMPLPEGITYKPLPSEQFVFVAAPSIAAQREAKHVPNWLAFNPDSTTYAYFTREFTRSGLRVEPIFYSTSMELLKELCLQGLGVALLPLQLIRTELTQSTLVMVGDIQWPRSLWLIKHGAFDDELTAEITGYAEAAFSGDEGANREPTRLPRQ